MVIALKITIPFVRNQTLGGVKMNNEELLERMEQWAKNTKEMCRADYVKKRIKKGKQENKQKIKERKKQYYEENKIMVDRKKACENLRLANKRKTDINYIQHRNCYK